MKDIDEPQLIKLKLKGVIGNNDKEQFEDKKFSVVRYGYEGMSFPDDDLRHCVEEIDNPVYMFGMNNTSDTGYGGIRFERGGEIIDITELVDEDIEEIIVDGKNSRVPLFQFGRPDYWTVYSLLLELGFSLIKDYHYRR